MKADSPFPFHLLAQCSRPANSHTNTARISLVTVNVLSYQLNHRRHHHRRNVSGASPHFDWWVVVGCASRPPFLPCTCNSISYKNHIYIALFANDWLRQWIWMGDEVGFRALLRKWGAASPSDGRKRIRMAFHPSGIFFSHYEEYYYMCYDTEACFTTATHEDNNCFMNISGREDIFCHMEEHTPTPRCCR